MAQLKTLSNVLDLPSYSKIFQSVEPSRTKEDLKYDAVKLLIDFAIG